MKLSTNAFCCGLPGAMSCQPVALFQARIAMLVKPERQDEVVQSDIKLFQFARHSSYACRKITADKIVQFRIHLDVIVRCRNPSFDGRP